MAYKEKDLPYSRISHTEKCGTCLYLQKPEKNVSWENPRMSEYPSEAIDIITLDLGYGQV